MSRLPGAAAAAQTASPRSKSHVNGMTAIQPPSSVGRKPSIPFAEGRLQKRERFHPRDASRPSETLAPAARRTRYGSAEPLAPDPEIRRCLSLFPRVAPRDYLGPDRGLSLFDHVELIGPDIMELLPGPARPTHFHTVDARARPQPEVCAQTRQRKSGAGCERSNA